MQNETSQTERMRQWLLHIEESGRREGQHNRKGLFPLSLSFLLLRFTLFESKIPAISKKDVVKIDDTKEEKRKEKIFIHQQERRERELTCLHPASL